MRRMLFTVAALAGCVSPPLESPEPENQCQPITELPQNVHDKADILFLIDNSGSMQPMSDQLKARFQEFLKVFDALADKGTYADLHIGVVTSDYGAGHGNNGCMASPGGQLGKLQAVGVDAAVGCKPPMGSNFISYKYTADKSNPNNLPSGQSLDATFTCMASVGSGGCGFEHQLESVYAALHNNLAENEGFLRDDAVLAVVFVTNEDDASAPPDSDVFDKGLTTQYGCLDSYSRQTRFAVVCCPPGMDQCDESQKVFPPNGSSSGPLAGCESAPVPPGKQYDIGRYVEFFTRKASEGGVKADPRDVILVAIDAPEDPFNVILANPGDTTQAPCAQANAACTCAPVLAHSCVNPQQPQFFGDPAIRINKVVRSAKKGAVTSICENDFSQAMQLVGKEIVSSLVAGCLEFDPTDHPDCVVQDVTEKLEGGQDVHTVPACADPPTSFPCWSVATSTDCATVSPTMKAITINRNGEAAPPHTVARVACGIGC